MKEEWKEIPGHPGYEASSEGRIRNSKTLRVLRPGTGSWGYQTVVLRLNGQPKTKRVHRLVAFAFIPNPENKPQVNHKNGIKTDNRVENLEWATASENTIHSYKKGLQKSKAGQNNGRALVTEKEVRMIREFWARGSTKRCLSSLFGLSRVQLDKIIYRMAWKHV